MSVKDTFEGADWSGYVRDMHKAGYHQWCEPGKGAFMFLVNLIEVFGNPKGEALESLKGNCTFVIGKYWIYEGELECLVDDGLEFTKHGEGIVECLGDLDQKELIQVCKDSFNVDLSAELKA